MLKPRLRIDRAGPLCTLQDDGRPGWLRYGVGASGPMDRQAFERAGRRLGLAGSGGIEFTAAGLDFTLLEGSLSVGMDGGSFSCRAAGAQIGWPAVAELRTGDSVSIRQGPAGNYGYLRFSAEIDVAPVLESRSTNSVVGLGGLEGRALRAEDEIAFSPLPDSAIAGNLTEFDSNSSEEGPVRVIWGLHADLFDPDLRNSFLESIFTISPRLDRMGVRLVDREGVFASTRSLSLVSDAVVAGDIQILGDGTPIVLMRDHQPTGGYPRIATIISADLDRFAQLRPGTEVRFTSVSLAKAHALLKRSRPA